MKRWSPVSYKSRGVRETYLCARGLYCIAEGSFISRSLPFSGWQVSDVSIPDATHGWFYEYVKRSGPRVGDTENSPGLELHI